MYTLPKLAYDYDELQPYIDKETMKIHHTKHHQGYTDKLNKALEDVSNPPDSIENLMRNISSYSTAIRNNGGGFYNHSLFWDILSPNTMDIPDGDFKTKFEEKFGSMEIFKEEFKKAAATRFGSGWAWLSKDENGDLFISSTANQDNPLMDCVDSKGTPLLGIDVWEHAYYLNYQNKRPDYIDAFFEIINWEQVADNY